MLFRLLIFWLACILITKGGLLKYECNNYNPCNFHGFEDLKQPKQLRSKDGFLEINLSVEMTKVKIEWFETSRRTYNGDLLSPTWFLQRNDNVHLNIKNNLNYPDPFGLPNSFRFPNTTNFHTHGLHVSPQAPQDDVFQQIAPKTLNKFLYIIDSEQPSGTFWYHPHFEGATSLQSNGGMGGVIVIEDEENKTPEYLWKISCPQNCQHDITLMFQPVLCYKGSNGYSKLQRQNMDDPYFRLNRFHLADGDNLESYAEENLDYYTTNGQLWPKYEARVGQLKRLRMVNGGGSDVLIIQILTLDGSPVHENDCKVLEIANDGIYLNHGIRPRFGKTVLPPGGRADWIIRCNQPQEYEIRAVNYNSNEDLSFGGLSNYEGVLLRLVIKGKKKTTNPENLPNDLPERPHFLQDLSEAKVDGQFMVEISSNLRFNREKFKSRDYFRYACEVGSVQEWFFVNSGVDSTHPLHLHVNSFQVISYNEYTGPMNCIKSNSFFDINNGSLCEKQYEEFDGPPTVRPEKQDYKYRGHDQRFKEKGNDTLGYVYGKPFRDVILVPPLSNITVRFVADRYVGIILVHCHIVMHEDEGMMFTFNVVEKGAPLSAHVSDEEGVYPGQCWNSDLYSFTKLDKITEKEPKLKFDSKEKSASSFIYVNNFEKP